MNGPTGERLDALLGAWAGQRRLPRHHAAAMLRAIVREPREEIPAAWWNDLTAQVTAAVVRATAPTAGIWGPFDPAAAA